MKKLFASLLILIGTLLWSQSQLDLDIDKSNYQLGELINVDLYIKSPQAFNHIFFDLSFNEEALDFVEFRKSDVTTYENCSILHATAISRDNKTGRLIFALNWDSNLNIYDKSEVIRLVFRAKQGVESSNLKFNNYGLKAIGNDNTGLDVEAIWSDSELFSINTSSVNSFIWIKSPQDGGVVNERDSLITVLSTKNSAYFMQLRNDSNSTVTPKYSCSLGYKENIPLPLKEGKNTVTALLYDENETVIAIDTSTINYLDNRNGLVLESPKQHSVVNQNRITVKVASSYTNVLINEEVAQPAGYQNRDDLDVYFKDVWLKPGFNTVMLKAVSDNDEIFTKQLTVYFENRDEIFRIISPENGAIKKWQENGTLTFVGEISQKYNSSGNLNIVTYDALFYPKKYNNRVVRLFEGTTLGATVIEEFEANDRPIEAAYKFVNTVPLDIGALGAGTLEIRAYKNKIGTTNDGFTSSLIILDDSKLEILVDQPRVYVDEDLSNRAEIENFNNLISPVTPSVFDNIDIDPTGEFSLKSTHKTIRATKPNNWYSSKQELLEMKNGDMLYYANKNGIARFKVAKLGNVDPVTKEQVWENYINDTDKFFVYDVLETDMGLLLGVSNYRPDGNTGLYLLKDGVLTNIVVSGQPITHVQFIRNVGDNIFLYGNHYSHIYSFNLSTLELNSDNKLETSVYNKYPLSNSMSLKDFQISPTLNTAMYLTVGGDLYFNSISTMNTEKYIPKDSTRFSNVSYVTRGDYKKSSYITWLINSYDETSGLVLHSLMERKSDGYLDEKTINTGLPLEKILSTGFNNDNFNLLTIDGDSRYIIKGKIFFDKFIPESVNEEYFLQPNANSTIPSFDLTDNKLIFTNFNGIYWGDGYTTNLYNFRSEIEPTGLMDFRYLNPDIDGIKGFSFSFPGIWLTEEELTFDFNYASDSHHFTSVGEVLTLKKWVEKYKDSEHWTSFLSYNSDTREYTVDVDFKELQTNGFLNFIFKLKAKGNASPVVNSLKIKKKVPVKIPTTNSSSATISVKGRVTDPTVKEVHIANGLVSNNKVLVDNTGSFKFDCNINSSTGNNVIKLTCVNQVGDSVTETFTVQLFESINGLRNTLFRQHDPASGYSDLAPGSNNEFTVTSNEILVNSDYFGLKGALVGYEILALNSDTVIKKGLFNTVVDIDFNTAIYSEDHSILESGKVVDGKIVIVPGSQRIRIYVENPGGKKEYFYQSELTQELPVFIYDMDVNDQKIILTNSGFRDSLTSDIYDNTEVKQELDVTVSEVTLSTVPLTFKYTKDIALTGRVESLQRVTNLMLNTSSEDLTFENGNQNIEIPVDEINQFSFNLKINLKEQAVAERDYYVILQPTAPYLSHLKSVIKLKIDKDFTGSHIIPDFTLMMDNPVENPSNQWSDLEKNSQSKPIRLLFERSLPPGARIKLVVNFNEVMDGKLDLIQGTTNKYRVLDQENNEINLTGVKFGMNRIRWTLYYNNGANVISSSIMTNRYMNDFIFELTGSSGFVKTVVDSVYREGTYYTNATLTNINVTKDESTIIKVFLNDNEIQMVNNVIELTPDIMLEGENNLVIQSNSDPVDFKYRILYDSKSPFINSPTISVNDDNSINYLSTIVNEANIETVKLFSHNTLTGIDSLITTIDYTVTPLNSNLFKIEWLTIGELVPLINPHNTNNPFFIQIIDKVGNETRTEKLFGPKLTNRTSRGELKVLDHTSFSYYNNNPKADYRFKDAAIDNLSWIFYAHNPLISNRDNFNKYITDSTQRALTIERPGTLTFNSIGIDSTKSDNITINAGEGHKIKFNEGFAFPPNKTLAANTDKPGINPSSVAKIILGKDYPEMSINFSLKLDESLTFEDDGEGKKIITLASELINEDETFIYYVKSNVNGIKLDLYLHHMGHNSILIENVAPDIWHNVLINISTINSNSVKLYFNDNDPVTIFLGNNVQTSFLKINSTIYLGQNDPATVNNGHFSVSRLFYIDRIVGSGDLISYSQELNTAFNRVVEFPSISVSNYSFNLDNNNVRVDAGSESYKLRVDNAQFTDKEDVLYEANGSALIGSKRHENYLAKSSSAIYFSDCTNPITRNLENTSFNQNYLPLKVVSGKTGRYTFGNRPTNHNIINDRYYTISGRVERLNGDSSNINLDAELVLIFNQNKVTYPLTVGDFQFVYDNFETPESVIMYIETDEDLKLFDNLQFVEGNSSLNEDAIIDTASYASTRYYFNNTGTVELSYKPFNINAFGHVDYGVEIFKSDFIRIYTKKNINSGAIEYYASVSGVTLASDTPVLEGWHNLLVTYSIADSKARFYIDGRIVCESNAPLTTPLAPSEDNVFIGGDPVTRVYAEGYIDNLKITNLFNDTDFVIGSNNQLKMTYTEGTEVTDSTIKVSEEPTALNSSWDVNIYSVLSKNRHYAPLKSTFNQDVTNNEYSISNVLDPGLYFARVKGEVNGKRTSNQLQFIKDDKPSLKIVKAPKLIIRNSENNLDFKILFDNSYQSYKLNSDRYPGYILHVRDRNSNQSERIFLCQDIYSRPHNQWKFKKEQDPDWTPVNIVNNVIDLSFTRQIWMEEVIYDYKSFYFTEYFDEAGYSTSNYILDTVNQKTVPVASLEETVPVTESGRNVDNNMTDYEYMLQVKLTGANRFEEFENINDFKISYTVDGYRAPVEVLFDENGFIDLYYDDMLKGLPYNDNSTNSSYNIIITLMYQNSNFQEQVVPIRWVKIQPELKEIEKTRYININSLDLLYLKEVTDPVTSENRTIGSIYAAFDYDPGDLESFNTSLLYNIKVHDKDNNLIYSNNNVQIIGSNSYVVIDDIVLGNDTNIIEVEVFEVNLLDPTSSVNDVSTISINTSSEAPEIFLTNSSPYYVSYNNMTFTWEGKLNGRVNENIEYSYNLDDFGWSTQVKDYKDLELYGLSEGFHVLKVKAVHNQKESTEAIARFFVDTNNPVINSELITIEPLCDNDGIINAVRISGQPNSVKDISLNAFYINGAEINVSPDGEFNSGEFPITMEGDNHFTLTAFDKVGNKTEITKVVDNNFIEILSPSGKYAKYSPLTLVGKISDTITQDVNIYIEDPLYKDVWHKAMVNSDRVFFVNDISLNPGSDSREATTNFRLKIEFSTGTVFYKDISVLAGNLFRPLIVNLSKQATQGAGKPIEITIDAQCNIDNIASWSIDYDGDDVYDDIYVTDRPDETKKEWKHSYSTIGEVKPRVRVITRDGEYFSQSASVIIHEEIKSASTTTVINPVAMDIAHCSNGSEKVFVLSGEGQLPKVEVFEIGRNLNYFSSPLFEIDIKSQIEGTATDLLSINEESFFIVTDLSGRGLIYLFSINEFGNFVVTKKRELNGTISSIALSNKYLFVTQSNNSIVTRFNRDGNNFDLLTGAEFPLKLPVGSSLLPFGTPITVLNGVLYAADKNSQEIIEYNQNVEPINYWGGYGHNDMEFIQPKLLSGYGNRLFIFDNSREDIQIFDGEGRIVTSLNSSGEYLENNFFTDILSLSALGREEGGRLYYYVVALSNSTEKLSLIRLPQWEEMRAKTRNNKIVFLKDKEVYTAKPDGSDLRKVLSTDSLPRIEGVVDYPTLSPDGRRLTFVSRKNIYTGNNEAVNSETWAYDNLYILEIGDQRPTKVPLTALNGFEIERPVFNSNGDTIAFSAKESGGFWQIYEYSWKNGTITKLFDSIENLRFPFYSPDDRFIVYSTDYDGDQDLEIFDKENPDVRVEVTSNNFRDSFPVWSRVYPFEISNTESKIESKIAFVSDRGFKKGIHYAYISRKSNNDIRVVTEGDLDVGNTPDIAAIEITEESMEGDYPAFTGDGVDIVYEEFDGVSQNLVKWNYKDKVGEKMNLPEGSMKPSGMRNTITGFKAELFNGNEVKLTWTPYTDHKTYYKLQYQKASQALTFTEKKVQSQDQVVVTGLEMNTDYIMRIIIEENEQKVAETRWIKVEVPEVVARPSYRIDETNPYLVHFHAWKPEHDANWTFSWIVDNQPIDTAMTSQDLTYQFGTSGEKSVQLRATNREGDFSSISSPLTINIVTDIEPVIEYTLIKNVNGGIQLDLDARNSRGSRINWSSAVWTITGAGATIPGNINVINPSVDVSNFRNKVNVNLKLSRQMVYGRQETDIIEVNKIIDLDYEDVKPIITYSASEENKRLLVFDGTNSLGNINWGGARWSLYADGRLIHSEVGVSSISYLFPETSRPQPYAIALTVGDTATGITKTASQTVSVDPAAIEPVIEYEILTLKDESGNDIGSKVILSATASKGSSIDFNQTEWNIPVAAQHGEQPKQKGPTAIFNLVNLGNTSEIEVSVTLIRQGGTDITKKTETIRIDSTGVTKTEIFVNKVISETTEGNVIVLDVLESKGPDIDWANTEWLINGQYSTKGPVARIDKSYIGEDQEVLYTVVLNRFTGNPITHTGTIPLNSYEIFPDISVVEKSEDNLTQKLTVKNTEGLNIDWTRTLWTIWDGNQSTIQKQGATIIHTFTPKEKALGYPVLAEMYLKNDDTPFYAYDTIQVDADEITPIIQWDKAIDDYKSQTESLGDSQVITFSALTSTGSAIDWSQAKWNFGDGSAPAYGATVQHKYAISDVDQAFNVALTLVRQNRDGSKESKTAYKTIDIGKDEINPVISVKIDEVSNTLVLSAEASEGRGLLLDRSVWVFAGKGDSENFSRSKSSVESINGSVTANANMSTSVGTSLSATAGFSSPTGPHASVTTGVSMNTSYSIGGSVSTSGGTSDTDNNNQSYSSQNIHTGAICRRSIEEFNYDDYGGGTSEDKMIWVTLFVYRMNSDGSTSGVSLTEQVSVNAVKAAGDTGKEYK